MILKRDISPTLNFPTLRSKQLSRLWQLCRLSTLVKTFATFLKNFQLCRLFRLCKRLSTLPTLATFDFYPTFTQLLPNFCPTFAQLSSNFLAYTWEKVLKNRHFSLEKWRFCQYLGIGLGGVLVWGCVAGCNTIRQMPKIGSKMALKSILIIK